MNFSTTESWKPKKKQGENKFACATVNWRIQLEQFDIFQSKNCLFFSAQKQKMDLNIQMLVVAIQTSKNTNPILSETWYEYQTFSHSIILPFLDVCLSTSITGMGFEMYSVSWKSKAIHRALFTSVRSMKCPLIRSFTFSDEYAIGKGYTNEWAAFFCACERAQMK